VSRTLRLLAVASALLAPTARAEFQPNVRPEMDVRRAAGPIVIDGRLDDAGWSGASRVEHFQQTYPEYNVEPGIGLRAWMTYDDENLYFAIETDEDPATIRGSMRDRDNIYRGDYLGLIVDTYGTGAWAYEFFVNPYGQQGDLRWTPNGEDGGFDVVWESEGRVTDTGWRVEVAIPFRSLRFPDRFEQEWRATFWYNRARASRERYSWSATDRNDTCWPCTWGTIRGIEGVNSGGALEILPSLTGYRVDSRDRLEDGGPDPLSDLDEVASDADFGVGARFGINSSTSVEATFNPDFSQVESDAAQIDVNTTFALNFPERRPFFQEGSDIYSTWINAVYTRTINNPQWATKLTSRSGGFSGGLLVARDEDSPLIVPSEEENTSVAVGRSTSVIGRGRFTRDDGSFLGLLGTFREIDDSGNNAVMGADGLYRLTNTLSFEGQVLVSHTNEPDLPVSDPGSVSPAGRDFALRDPETGDIIGERTFKIGDRVYTERLDGQNFWGHAAYLSLENFTRYWGIDVDYWRTSNSFRADNGFITQNDYQRASITNAGTIEVNNDLVDEIRPFLNVSRVWNTDGQRKDEWIRPEINVDLKSQTGLEFGALFSNEWFRGQSLNGIHRWNVDFDTRPNQYFDFSASYEQGDFVARTAVPARLGDGKAFSAGMTFRAPFSWMHLDRLTLQPSISFQKLAHAETGSTDGRGYFEGYVFRTRANFQATRDFFTRLIFQYNDFRGTIDIEPLLTYRIDPFTLLYVGATTRQQDFDGFDHGLDDPMDLGYVETERQWFLKIQAQFRS